MSVNAAPYPLNPNLSCVERVRRLFCEIVKRRLILLARQRPKDSEIVNAWVIDKQFNTLPCFLFNDDALRSEWHTVQSNEAIRDFVFGLVFEIRQRCFDTPEDYTSYLTVLAESATQFNDELSVIDNETLKLLSTTVAVTKLLGGNPWIIPIVLFEQLTASEIGIDIAIAEQETTLNGQSEGIA